MAAGFFDFREQVTARRASAVLDDRQSSRLVRVPISVSQLTARIGRVIEAGFSESLLVQGELSNFNHHHASGHFYFTLKDAENCIECVIWKSNAARLKFEPGDGMELLATGRLQVYGKRGRYQLYVTSLQPIGQGALELALQQMRAKLEAEGLFSVERKRPLPLYPSTIAIITSREGAAFQDMIKVLRRYRWLRLLLCAVPVQGEGAAPRIADALAHINRCAESIGAPDVILLGRGGGSLEDLWAFNEEAVARAIAASHIPVVTGIGHEVDVSIADQVADHHAHTPTEAAQVIVSHWRNAPDVILGSELRLSRSLRLKFQNAVQGLLAIQRHELFRRPLDRVQRLVQQLDDRQRGIDHAIDRKVHNARHRLADLSARFDGRLGMRLISPRDRINQLDIRLLRAVETCLRRDAERLTRVTALLSECHPRHRVTDSSRQLSSLAERLKRAAGARFRTQQAGLHSLESRLRALSPHGVLARGYTITTRKRDGKVIRSASELRAGDRLHTRFADGEAHSIVEDRAQLPLFE